MKGTVLLAICCWLLLTSSGCGSSGGGGALTRAEFKEKANAICKSTAARRTRLLLKAGKEHSFKTFNHAEEVEIATEVLLPLVQQMVGELKELQAPEGKEGRQLESMVKTFEAGLKKSEASHDALLKSTTFTPARVKAKEAAIEECRSV